MKAEILSVGTELLMGQIANTDAQYISKRLPELGIGVYYHTVVGDNQERVKDALLRALSRADVIITTGGLGPTQDDLTKETVAQTLGLQMRYFEAEGENIKEYFKKNNRPMPDSNLRQAYFPENSIIMKNITGTAPGCIVPAENGCIVILPGPPKELKPMFDNEAMPYLSKLSNTKIKSEFIRIIGLGESSVEEKMLSLVEGQTNPTFATYCKDGVITIRVTASGEDAESKISEADKKLKDIFGEYIFTDKDEEIDEVVVRLLKERNLKIATAESCTGGTLAGAITSHGGSSEVFETGLVTYSENTKKKMLGVRPETLERYTVYSAETAKEMAEGLRKITGADVCVSVTGVAGPGGGTDESPVGTVYIGVYYNGNTTTKKFYFRNLNRENVRAFTVTNALNMVRKEILK